MEFAKELERNRKIVVANQLLKPGASIGANASEAQNAESKAAFMHKRQIAANEADETLYLFKALQASENYPYREQLIESADTIMKMLQNHSHQNKNRSLHFQLSKFQIINYAR
jgi:four helix bundle protein